MAAQTSEIRLRLTDLAKLLVRRYRHLRRPWNAVTSKTVSLVPVFKHRCPKLDYPISAVL
jgi:hypothetical protein